MTQHNFENLRRSFIIDDDITDEDLEENTRNLLNISKIDAQGRPLIVPSIDRFLTKSDRILLVFLTSYLASRLQKRLGIENTISEDITASEIARITMESQAVVNARLKELKDAKHIVQQSRGIYRAYAPNVKNTIGRLKEKYDRG